MVKVGGGLGWFVDEFLCFSSKKADIELTFLFSPLLLPWSSIGWVSIAGFTTFFVVHGTGRGCTL